MCRGCLLVAVNGLPEPVLKWYHKIWYKFFGCKYFTKFKGYCDGNVSEEDMRGDYDGRILHE